MKTLSVVLGVPSAPDRVNALRDSQSYTISLTAGLLIGASTLNGHRILISRPQVKGFLDALLESL